MKMLAGGSRGGFGAAVVVGLALVLLTPSWGLARSDSGFLRNEVDWSYAGDFNLHVGRMYLDDSEWAPVEEQMRYGAEIEWTNSQHWAGMVIGFFYSNEDETAGSGANEARVDTEFLEVDVGLRKVFYNLGWFRPFLGVGGSLYSVDVEVDSAFVSENDNDIGFGGYGEVGFYIDVYGPFHIGALARYSAGRVDLLGSSSNPGGLMVTGMIGTHWIDY